MKVVADSDIPFLKGVLEPFAEVVYMPGERIAADVVRDADALLVRTRTRCDASLLEHSQVRLVATATIGYDHFDTDFCASRGISVATAAGSNSRGVLQWVAAALAWLAERSGDGEGFPLRTTLGVVGVGSVGSLVARWARLWGFRVMCSDPPRERAEGLGPAEGFYPLQTILRTSDAITLHVPLTLGGGDATAGLVDRGFLAATKPHAVVVNSSRGAVLDTDALLHSAAAPQGFIIDTWPGEPDIDRRLLARTLLATPHIAGYTIQGKAAATAMAVNAVAREFGIDGLPGWFPPGIRPSSPRDISWEEMRRTMPAHFDIAAQSAALKAAPENFEQMRREYCYRGEYF